MGYEYKLAEIGFGWTVAYGPLWLGRKAIRVHAWQVKLEDGGMIPTTTAAIQIFINEQLAYERDIPCPQLYGKEFLVVQVLTMADMEKHLNPDFRQIMKDFGSRYIRSPEFNQ